MEYPPLVAGQTALFAVHLTRLDDFKALNAGRPRSRVHAGSRRRDRRAGRFRTVAAGRVPCRRRAPAAGRYRWALVVEAPGLSDRHDLGAVTVFARRSGRERRRGQETGRRSGRHRLSEGAAVDQRVRDRTGARGRRAAVDPRPGGDRSPAGRRGDRRGAGRRPIHGRVARVHRGDRSCRRRRWAGSSRDCRAATIARRSWPRSPRPRPRSKPPAPSRPARNGCWPIAPSRRGAWKTRSGAARWRRPGSARREARLAQRDETLGAGGGAAAGNAFVLRRRLRAASPR